MSKDDDFVKSFIDAGLVDTTTTSSSSSSKVNTSVVLRKCRCGRVPDIESYVYVDPYPDVGFGFDPTYYYVECDCGMRTIQSKVETEVINIWNRDHI